MTWLGLRQSRFARESLAARESIMRVNPALSWGEVARCASASKRPRTMVTSLSLPLSFLKAVAPRQSRIGSMFGRLPRTSTTSLAAESDSSTSPASGWGTLGGESESWMAR